MRVIFTLFSLLILFSSAAYTQSATLVFKAELPATLNEISGMIHLNGKLYGNVDSDGPAAIFEIDSTTGLITKTITLGAAINKDWEDITQDDTYIYIGDFGNNVHGNRTDLKFYRFAKSLITSIPGSTGTITAGDIQTINFAYEDQTDFTSLAEGTTRFDCEAVIFHGDSLHLFTKNWSGTHTVHYVLSATPGTHSAFKRDSLNTGGILITSATKTNDNIVALLGYSKVAECGLWLITGFSDMSYLFNTAANKQKIDLGSALGYGQIEGITAVSQTRVLVTNEKFDFSVFHIKPNLYGLDLAPFIADELLPAGIANFTSRLNNNEVLLSWEFTEPEAEYFEIEASTTGNDYVKIGKVYNTNAPGGLYQFTDHDLPSSGIRYYRIKIISNTGRAYYSKVVLVKNSNDKQFNLQGFPSPFNDKLDISFYSDTDQQVQVSILDIFGRTLKTRQFQCVPGKYSYAMDGLYALSKGVYFLTGRTKSSLFVRRIVRQ